jgi:polyisoprenoid-binding protein YceI
MLCIGRVIALAIPLIGVNLAQAAALYKIDPTFTTVHFSVEGIDGLLNIRGMFGEFSGELLLDLVNPQKSTVTVDLDSASADMEWTLVNDLIKSPDYLNSNQFPQLTYKSDSIDMIQPDHVTVHGNLTLRGITLPMTLDARLEGLHEQPEHGQIAEFHLNGTLNRDDFGMTADHPQISSIITIDIKSRINLNP